MGRRHHPRTLQIRLSNPRPLLSSWPQLAKGLRNARRRILLTDFDGTLSPIRRMPDAARLSDRTRRLLARIAADGAVVGIVSGRGLRDLRARVNLPGLWYVGSHGYVLCDPASRVISIATPVQRRRIRSAVSWLRPRLSGLRGVKLDAKIASLAVHYRAASPRTAEKAAEILRRLLEKIRGLRLLQGKKVWEVLPWGRVNKWTAVSRLLKRETAGHGKPFVVYLGDDTTDESVFKNMDGVSVVVGRGSGSSAAYSLRSPGEVREFLKAWVRQCSGVAGD